MSDMLEFDINWISIELVTFIEDFAMNAERYMTLQFFLSHSQLKDSTVINIWLGGWENEMKKVTEKGHKAILSACWYLNYINYGMDWPEVSLF